MLVVMPNCNYGQFGQIWSIARLMKCPAPLINYSIAQLLTNCTIFGQLRSTLALGLGLRLGLGLGLELWLVLELALD